MVSKESNPRSKAVSKSWSNKKVAKARATKHHVKVRGHGEYRSVLSAFQVLGLPTSQHIKFRHELKQKGKATFHHEGRAYHFSLVPPAK